MAWYVVCASPHPSQIIDTNHDKICVCQYIGTGRPALKGLIGPIIFLSIPPVILWIMAAANADQE
jgi:hypothetical protein